MRRFDGALPPYYGLGSARGRQSLRRVLALGPVRAKFPPRPQVGIRIPSAAYLRGIAELRDAGERLPEAAPTRHGPFDVARVRDTARRFLAGEDELTSLVRQLVLVTVWHEAAFDTVPETVTAEARRSG